MDTTVGKNGSWAQFLESFLLMLIVLILGVLVLVARTFWVRDFIGGATIGLYVCFIVYLSKNGDELSNLAARTLVLGAFTLSVCSLFFVTSVSGSGVWVNTKTKETTISKLFLVVTPFSPSITFVETSQAHKMEVRAQTSDGTPLTCTATTSGIALDSRDEVRLHERLTATDNPQQHINSVLNTRIREEVARVISSKQNQEIAQLLHFYIPHQVGSGVEKTLSSLGLRWQNGKVYLFCELIFNS